MKKTKRTHWDRNTESVDDYLKAIHSIGGDERRRVGGSELAARLDVSPASVTNMLQKLASEPINGEAVSLLAAHSEANGKASDSRIWISNKTGLPLKSEVHLSSGTVVTDDFRYGNIEAPPGVK